jgi:hypothetical protein
MFISGFVLSLYYIFRKYNYGLFWVLIITIASFFIGVVLTIPPPAFHRFSLAFPFIIIILSLPFYAIMESKINVIIKYLFLALIIIVYCSANLSYFSQQTKNEHNNESIKLGELIRDKYPARKLYIASFPGFNFEKIFYFVEKEDSRKIITDYHRNLLENFNPQEKYVYVIIFPETFNLEFQKMDKQGKIINFSNNFSLFIN